MKKFEGILICTDLDGTLLKNDKTISDENLRAIEYFKAEGGIFTFITGRMPYFVSNIYEKINPNGPFGCINGGGIYDHRIGEYLWTQPISHSVLEMVEHIDKNIPDMGIQVNMFDKIYFCKENSAMADFRKLTGSPNIVCDYREIEDPIAKIVFGDKNEENMIRLEQLLYAHPRADEFVLISSEHTLYEILPKGINKGTILPRLAECMNIDENRIIAVGDYNNDVDMLRLAKVGVAVSNACQAAIEAADYVTVSNEENAIAKIISDIENGILQI